MATGYPSYSRTKPQAARQAQTNFLLRFLAGVAAPNTAGGPFGGFQAGLGGALAQSQAAQEAQKLDADQELQRQMDERLFGLRNYEADLGGQRLAEEIRHNQAEEGARAKTPESTELGLFLSDPAKYKAYMDAKAAATPASTTGFDTFVNEAKYKKEHPELFNPTPEDDSWIGGFVKTTRSGRQFLDTSELLGKDKGQALRWASKNNIPAVGSADLGQLQDIDAARGNIEDMLNAVEPLLPKDAQGRVAALPGIRLSNILQTSAQRAAFGTYRSAAVRNFRAMAGSKGLRLNQAEIELAVKNDIPNITDTYEVAKQKMENVRMMLDNAEGPLISNKWGNAKPSGHPLDRFVK